MIPMTAHIDNRMRRKIRKGEFIDLNRVIVGPSDRKNRKWYELNAGTFEEIREEGSL